MFQLEQPGSILHARTYAQKAMGLGDLLPQPTGKPVIAAVLLCKGGATRGAGRRERQRQLDAVN